MTSNKEIELIGMKLLIQCERDNGRTPEDLSTENLGYKIRSSTEKRNYGYIEVKARADEGDIVLAPNKWLMAQRLKEYWLYIVTNAATNLELHLIQKPTYKFVP